MATYLIVIAKTDTGYSAHCPDVLGCASVGKTIEQVRRNMKNALQLHFEGMMEDGCPIPQSEVSIAQEVKSMCDIEESFIARIAADSSSFAEIITLN